MYVSSLCGAMSGVLQGTSFDLHNETIRKPMDSSPDSDAWRTVEMWPTMGNLEWSTASSGMFSLAGAAHDAVICVVCGAGTQVFNGVLELEKNACIVFDNTCMDVHLKDVVIKGVTNKQLDICVKMESCCGRLCCSCDVTKWWVLPAGYKVISSHEQ